jgi:Carboxypeptidase regulatory-like domain
MNTSPNVKAFAYRSSALPSRAYAFVLVSLIFCSLLLLSASGAKAQSGRAPQGRPTGGGSGGNNSATQSAARGQSSISGRVIYEETGEPVRGARVRITSVNGLGPMGASLTNDRGEFRFDNLAAGEYHVVATAKDAAMVNAATFAVPLPSGDPQRDDAAFEAARRENDFNGGSLEVSVDGTHPATVEVVLPRAQKGGGISGRVLYEDGKPAPKAQVTFLNRKEMGGRMIGPTKLSALTDERGFYHVNGLPPGEYTVSARLQEKVYIDKQGRTYGGLVILTYYPSATSARAASPVHVAKDQETGDINITLVKRDTRAITGTALARASGRPLSRVQVRLRNRDDLDLPFSAGSDDRFIWTDAQGRFTFNNVLDGDYLITVGGLLSPPPPRGISMNPNEARSNEPPRLRDSSLIYERFPRPSMQGLIEKQQEVTVSGADVANLMIEVSEGGRVSGRVVFEGEGQPPPRIMIASESVAGERRPGSLARLNPDSTFTMSGVPEGPLSLDVLISPPGRFYVKSITAGGVDMMREPLLIGDGIEIRDVRIVLSSDVATLKGRVLAADGTHLGGATVLLAPADQNRQRLSRGRLVGVTDSDGRFMIGAAPGEYRAVIWRGRPPSDEEALRKLAESAPSVTLRAGERQDLELVAPDEK